MTTVQTDIDRPQERPPLPNPKPLKQRSIPWKVLTPATLPAGDDWVLFAITPEAYANLSRNQAEVLRFVSEAMWRLRYYRGELPPSAPSRNK